MDNKIKNLKETAEFFKRMNRKVLLYKLINQAKAEYDNYNFQKGKELLNEALRHDENNPVIMRGLGCCAQNEGNFEEALKYFTKALSLSDKKEVEYTLIGMLYYFQDNLNEALRYFNLAIDCNEEYEKAYEGRNQTMLENHLKIIDLQETLDKIYQK